MCNSYRFTPLRLILSLAFVTLGLTQGQDSTVVPIAYRRGNSTCVSADIRLSSAFGETANVKVQPNCDVAIDALCSLNARTDPVTNYDTYTAIGPNNTAADPGACQAHLVGLGRSNSLKYQTYAQCVQGFQNITIDCMLIGTGRDAKRGAQAGVRGVTIVYPGNTEAPRPKELLKDPPIYINGLLDAGFLVGPPGYFGAVNTNEMGVFRPPIPVPIRQ
ncbi:MAG: hypothetical protein Q9221_001998 [Calogaya cf. arnoldii]